MKPLACRIENMPACLLKVPDILRRDVAVDATLYINSTDTSWLKIIADEETASHTCIGRFKD